MKLLEYAIYMDRAAFVINTIFPYPHQNQL
jgi:hypothetical protein